MEYSFKGTIRSSPIHIITACQAPVRESAELSKKGRKAESRKSKGRRQDVTSVTERSRDGRRQRVTRPWGGLMLGVVRIIGLILKTENEIWKNDDYGSKQVKYIERKHDARLKDKQKEN